MNEQRTAKTQQKHMYIQVRGTCIIIKKKKKLCAGGIIIAWLMVVN